MFRVDKRFILLLVVILFVGVLSGCSSPPKAPEGVDQEFYEDMVKSLKKLEQYKGDRDKNGLDVVEKYHNNKVFLKEKEEKIIEAVNDLYLWVWMYHEFSDTKITTVEYGVENVVKLMDLNIDLDKLTSNK